MKGEINKTTEQVMLNMSVMPTGSAKEKHFHLEMKTEKKNSVWKHPMEVEAEAVAGLLRKQPGLVSRYL